ncbi:MAG: hypothetical protein P4L33_14845 [Capsulimonadaceae bacterium]|nr:hypothetical protein [Capsulimonadaceae bacterium]
MTKQDTLRIPWPPRIGVVIGTYGSVSQIRLQLETRRQFWPGIPVLIHDDSSPEAEELRRVCDEYGATYYTTPVRVGSGVGDMASIVNGLDWAHENGIDLLVKLSRRFVICHDWTDHLMRLAYNTQAATYTNPCSEYRFGCRSECMAVHVESWRNSDTVRQMRYGKDHNSNPSSQMEVWYYKEAVKIYKSVAPMLLRARNGYLRTPYNLVGLAPWNILGHSRHTASPGTVWHCSHFPEDYHALTQVLGLTDISLDEFRWIYVDQPDQRIPYPAPGAAVPAFGPTSDSIKAQDRRIEEAGFVDAQHLPEFARLTSRPANLSSLTTRAMHARITNRMDMSLFDILRWFRVLTAPVFPYIFSRTSWDTINVATVWRKQSIKDAIAAPRHENFSRYVCQKAVEGKGIILTIGDHPIGLTRHAALTYGSRLRITGVLDETRQAALLAATGRLNDWHNFSLYTPAGGQKEASWIERLGKIPFNEVSMLLVRQPGKTVRVLDALAELIERDMPQIVVSIPDSAKAGADSIADVVRRLEAFGYGCAAIGEDGNADGLMQPVDVSKRMKRQAIYAWRRARIGE